ncbi:MAG: hypothetical protein VKP62_07070 [Candidatus Sericytochromatia bacterium]|nr:hypothetical protein [Candidatus Sericytochromatia bacterium]
MLSTLKTAAPCVCPSCAAFTVSMPGGQGDYCPGCFTVVKRYRGVKLVQPNAFRSEHARA